MIDWSVLGASSVEDFIAQLDAEAERIAAGLGIERKPVKRQETAAEAAKRIHEAAQREES